MALAAAKRKWEILATALPVHTRTGSSSRQTVLCTRLTFVPSIPVESTVSAQTAYVALVDE
jgi:hypothetical protein